MIKKSNAVRGQRRVMLTDKRVQPMTLFFRFTFVIGWLSSLVWADFGDCAETANERRPNVLVVMCDQLNARVLGCYGGPVSTPHIDRIAGEGVCFDQAVCPTPFCSPTRASIITGMYPHTHGIVTNIGRRDCFGLGYVPTELTCTAQPTLSYSIAGSCVKRAFLRRKAGGGQDASSGRLRFRSDWFTVVMTFVRLGYLADSLISLTASAKALPIWAMILALPI